MLTIFWDITESLSSKKTLRLFLLKKNKELEKIASFSKSSLTNSPLSPISPKGEKEAGEKEEKSKRSAPQVKLIFCKNEDMLALNKRFRHLNKPTDVLSFAEKDYLATESKKNFLAEHHSLGEIYINYSWIKETNQRKKLYQKILGEKSFSQTMLSKITLLKSRLSQESFSLPSLTSSTTNSPKITPKNLAEKEKILLVLILFIHGYLHLLGYDHEKDQGEMTRLEKKLRKLN